MAHQVMVLRGAQGSGGGGGVIHQAILGYLLMMLVPLPACHHGHIYSTKGLQGFFLFL